MPQLKDLGLTYDQAMHGIQTHIGFKISNGTARDCETKHMRTGVDSAHVSQLGLATLLIQKGIFTETEYAEAMRLAANHELAVREEEEGGRVKFR